MDAVRARLQRHLQDIEQQQRTAEAVQHKILEAAREREMRVAAEIKRIRSTVLTHPEDGEHYCALIQERARLHQMLMP